MAIRFPSALDSLLGQVAEPKEDKPDKLTTKNPPAKEAVNKVVNKDPEKVAKNRSADRHNKDTRRIYMREYMKTKRAGKKDQAVKNG